MKRVEILLVFLISLVTLDIFLHFSDFSFKNKEQKSGLPSYMNKANIDELMYLVKKSMNNEDYIRLYSEFNKYAQDRFNKDEVVKELKRVANIVGEIETYSFNSAYSIPNNEGSDTDWYLILYDANYTKGKGTVELTIRDEKSNWGLVGLSIKIN